MIYCSITTHWIEIGDENNTVMPYFITTGGTWVDVTKENVPIPGDTNVVVVEPIVTDEEFAEIEADKDLYVNWDEPNPKPPNGTPGAAEFGLLRAFLAKPPIKMSQVEIKDAIGIIPHGRSRSEITDSLRDWIRSRTV